MTYSEAQKAIEILKEGNSLQTSYADYGGMQLRYNYDNNKIIFERKYWANGAAQYDYREMTESEFEAYISALYTDWDDFAAAFGV